jgi:hypothetical protein
MRRPKVAVLAVGCLALARIAAPQMAVSAKSGMINYVEGQALLDNRPVTLKLNSFPQLQEGSELRTEEGRAEVLLGPGVFMRLGENSAVRMVDDDIMDTRVEYLRGSVIVEVAGMVPDQEVAFSAGGAMIDLLKKGLYRIDGEPPQLRVYDGEASVVNGGQIQTVTRGRLLRLDGVAVAEKFDANDGDALFRWAKRRSEYLAVASISAAGRAQRSSFFSSNSWVLNPFFGFYTFMPFDGFYQNYWGSQFWGPGTGYWGGGSKPVAPAKPGRPTQGPVRPRPIPVHPGGWSGRAAGSTYASWTAHSYAPGHPVGSGYSGGAGRSGGGGYSGSARSGGGYTGSGSSGGGGGHSSGGGGGGGHSSGGGSSSGGHSR